MNVTGSDKCFILDLERFHPLPTRYPCAKQGEGALGKLAALQTSNEAFLQAYANTQLPGFWRSHGYVVRPLTN